MTYTRRQLYDATLEVMDGADTARFGETLLGQIVDAVHGRGWRRILNANRTYRFAARTVTPDSSGAVTYTALGSGSADTLERCYKVLGAAQGAIRYTPAEFMDDPLAQSQTPTANRYTFQRQGESVIFLPVLEQEMTVWTNHLPQRVTALAADGSAVTWPEDYEIILAYEAGARYMAKGAAETDGTQWLQQLADDLWRDLLSDAARFTTDPIVMGASDSPSDWGGI
jgi:hypothetical protein